MSIQTVAVRMAAATERAKTARRRFRGSRLPRAPARDDSHVPEAAVCLRRNESRQYGGSRRRKFGPVQKAREHVAAGKRFVVDMDLEKIFDRVNHDVLMARVGRRIGDKRVLGLIRRFLQAGLMTGGL